MRHATRNRLLAALAPSLLLAACDMGPKEPAPAPEPKVTAAPTTNAARPESVLRLGAPIEAAAQHVALADVVKTPDAYAGKTFTTTGTVTAVCQHKGCWMEIRDDASQAHIKMAGHAFFVPRSASGKKARVQATLVKAQGEPACEGAGHGHEPGKGCRAEAEAQLGRPLAKLELVAQGVELM